MSLNQQSVGLREGQQLSAPIATLRVIAIFVASLFVASPCLAEITPSNGEVTQLLTVGTTLGPVRGVMSASGVAIRWLGIPYAKPPLGDLRWKAPRVHESWTGVLNAETFGSPCAQIGSIYGPPPAGKAWGAANVEAFNKPVGNEDCLTLNIWRPNVGASQLPVIVFIHGGSNIVGFSGDPVYDGEKLASATNSVVITLNYRLGMFGWMTHPAFQDEDLQSSSGNFGTLDIIQALRFVQSNAEAFGGDRKNITLMGQSAGAIDTYCVMGSPLGSGLFQKAIVLSGLIGSAKKEDGYEYSKALVAQLILDDKLATTTKTADAYATKLGASWVKQYLKSKTTNRLLSAQLENSTLRHGPSSFGDGAVIPVDLTGAFERGQFQHVPMIVGLTRDEGKLFTSGVLRVSDAERFTMMVNTDPNGVPTAKLKDLVSPYLLPFMGSGLYDAYAWLILAVASHKVNAGITSIAQYEPKVFAYRFDWNRGPEPWKSLYGAGHAIDLPFVFGNFSNNFFSMDFSKQNRPGREALSQTMMKAISAFVRTGDPNIPELKTTWVPWNAPGNKRSKFVFDATDQQVVLSVH